MKKLSLLLLIILFLWINGWAQSGVITNDQRLTDTTGKVKLGNTIITNTSIYTAGYGLTYIQSDTVKCVMLVCDTSVYDNGRGFTITPYSDRVTWMFGYSIQKWNERSVYLDDKKIHLKKSIIVWISMIR